MTTLSTTPSPGARHVRATSLLRVLHPHQVSTLGAPVWHGLGEEALPGAAPIAPTPPQAGQAIVHAVAGDLAIGVVDAQTGDPIGYSYLTGPAITCMNYTIVPDRFAPAACRRLTDLEAVLARATTAPPDHPDRIAGRFFDEALTILQQTKHSEHDVAVFEVNGGREYPEAGATLARMWCSYKTAEGPPDPAALRCHLIGLILGPSPVYALMHLQPPRHAQPHCADYFQIQLLLGIGAPS